MADLKNANSKGIKKKWILRKWPIGELISAAKGVEDLSYYCPGILFMWRNSGYISNGYFQDNYSEVREYLDDTVYVKPPKVKKILPEGIRVMADTNAYLVLYVPGETRISGRTGKDQVMVDYNYPLIFLRVFPKSKCHYVIIRDGVLELEALEGVFEQSKNLSVQKPASGTAAAVKKVLDARSVERIRKLLDKAMEQSEFILPSAFPKVIEGLGIGSYKDYATNVNNFVIRYLPDYEVQKNVMIGGIRYPGIITRKGYVVGNTAPGRLSLQDIAAFAEAESESGESVSPDAVAMQASLPDEAKTESPAAAAALQQDFDKTQTPAGEIPSSLYFATKESPVVEAQPTYEEQLDELRTLFSEGKYCEFLSSDTLKRAALCTFPMEIVEMALTCAARLIEGCRGELGSVGQAEGGAVEVRLTGFQRNLLMTPDVIMLYRTWRENVGFRSEIMEECADSAVVPIGLPYGNRTVARLLNGLGRCTVKNDNYPGLVKRFSLCMNNITPYILLIWSFVHKTPNTVDKAIDAYFQMIMEMIATTPSIGNIDEVLLGFGAFLTVVHERVFRVDRWSRSNKVKIMAVYVEAGEMELLRETIRPLTIRPLSSNGEADEVEGPEGANRPQSSNGGATEVEGPEGAIRPLSSNGGAAEVESPEGANRPQRSNDEGANRPQRSNWDDVAAEMKLIDLYFDDARCREQDIRELLENKINLRMLQKVVSLIWEKYANEQVLPLHMMKILCWICLDDHYTSVDEIMRYYFKDKDFKRDRKQLQLINSLTRIYEAAHSDIRMYILASYVVHVVAQDFSADKLEKLPEENRQALSDWNSFSASVLSEVERRYPEISKENEKDYLELFRIFSLDISCGMKLQKKYLDWYMREYFDSGVTPEKAEAVLPELYDHKAYEAYINVYRTAEEIDPAVGRDYVKIQKLVKAMIELQRYAEAIEYVRQNDALSVTNRDKLLIAITTENFKTHGLSPEAFNMFGETDSIDYAAVMLRNYENNKFDIVNDLIAIYCRQEEYIKALYLYRLYQYKAEIGYTRLYSHVKNRLRGFIDRTKNHYSVIELAFQTLTYDKLIEFFEWAQMFEIYDRKNHNPIHAFSYYYDKLLVNSTSEVVWKDFLKHLSMRMDMNAWDIVVCETVLTKKLGYTGKLNARLAIKNIISNSEVKNIPYNFLPYIYAYIEMTGDRDICQDVEAFLRKKDVLKRLVAENPWYRSYRDIMAAFKEYCINQYGTTGQECFINLVKLIGMDLDASGLEILAEISTDKAPIFNQVCRNYLNGTDLSDTVELLNGTHWNNMTQRDSAMLDILKIIFSEADDLLGREELLRDEGDETRFKRDVATILSVFPDKRELFAFDESCQNTAYKLLVYSYVFRVLYDQDIYNKYELSYEEVRGDRRIRTGFLKEQASAFCAQLEWNADYPFFYKRWRYLKMYLAQFLYREGPFDDRKILSLMKSYGHYEEFYGSSYKGFTENVEAFCAGTSFDKEGKEFFLLSLMKGHLNEFFRNYAPALIQLPEKEKAILRNLISEIDYREANKAFYITETETILAGRFDEALSAAEAVSVYAKDAVRELRAVSSKDEIVGLFTDIACDEKQAHAVKRVFEMDPELFDRYAAVWVPLACSRQFIFHLYGRMRSQIILRAKYDQTPFIDKFTGYLRGYDQQEADGVRNYLSALQACMDNDREKALSIVRKTDIFSGIPVQWKEEGEEIVKFAEGRRPKFRPGSANLDNSERQSQTRQEISFVKKLKEILGVRRKNLTKEEAVNLLKQYTSAESDHRRRLQSAVDLVYNYPKLDPKERKHSVLPARNTLTVMVGLDALSSSISLTADERFTIVCEVYDQCRYLAGRKDSAGGEFPAGRKDAASRDEEREIERSLNEVREYFGRFLRQNISLQSWIRHADTIRRYLEDMHAVLDFAELQKNILAPAAALFDPQVSYEQRYAGLLEVQETLEKTPGSSEVQHYAGLLEAPGTAGSSEGQRYGGLPEAPGTAGKSEGRASVYAHNLLGAIRRYCKTLEEGIRLRVDIVNENDTVTDGYVYFMVENIGKRTVSLQDKDISIVFMQEGRMDRDDIVIDSISSLQSQFITGGRIRLALNASEETVSVRLAIRKKVGPDTNETICSTAKTLTIRGRDASLKVGRLDRYDVDDESAVTDPDMLFGREDIKEDLSYVIPSGVTVIYGPSRIGKTSIMNWIRNDLAKNKGNVVTILFGGEGGMGKNTDYVKNFADAGKEVPFDNDEEMSEYLLVKTIVKSMTDMRTRVRRPSSGKDTKELFKEIVEVLSDDSMSISDRYYEMNEKLVAQDTELWLMLDEFQSVVGEGKWNPDLSCSFISVCGMLSGSGDYNIKLILCGSDDLLRYMVLEDKSVWRKTFPQKGRIAVGPIRDEKAFSDMLQKDKKIVGTNIVYSGSALKALFSYTRGVALYGKEICNTILDEIYNAPEKFAGRRTVYASDVAAATQQLLNRQSSEIDMRTKEGILEIYDAVTKNLDRDTDMQYLWFIANWINDHPDQKGFRESVFAESGTLRSRQKLRDSIAIAVARGILRSEEGPGDGTGDAPGDVTGDTSGSGAGNAPGSGTREASGSGARNAPGSGQTYYTFRTIFYYFAFLGFAKDNLDPAKIFVDENEQQEEEPESLSVTSMIEEFGKLSPTDRVTVLSSAYVQKLNREAKKMFKESVGDYYEGDNIGRDKNVKNISVSIQNMTNTLNGILTAGSHERILEGLDSLPRLEQYLPQLRSEGGGSGSGAGYGSGSGAGFDGSGSGSGFEGSGSGSGSGSGGFVDSNGEVVSEQRLSLAMDNCVADYQESLEASNVESVPYHEIFKIKEDEYEDFMEQYNVPEFFLSSLKFAYQLDQLFMKGAVGGDSDRIDFSPVTIMYCKLVESMLKEYYIEPYGQAFENVETDMYKPHNRFERYKWKEISSLPVQEQQRLTIGSFVFPLNKEWAVKKIARETNKTVDLWRTHRGMIQAVRDIRNPSAHGSKDHRISLEEKNSITNQLLDQHGLMRLVEIVKG